MSRQDANATFALTSFLYGGNASYIEDLYARYEKDPNAVDAQWRAFFQSLKDDPATVVKSAQGTVLAQAELAGPRQRRSGRRARRQLGRDREGDRRQDQGQGADARRRAFVGRCAAGDARFHSRADAHPRLSHPRPFPRQARSARPRAGKERGRTRSAAPTASPTPISIARFSSTRCSVSNSRPCARSSRSCSAPIARRSASNSCTSPIRRRRRGSRNASRARTRKSPSRAKASARSSTS